MSIALETLSENLSEGSLITGTALDERHFPCWRQARSTFETINYAGSLKHTENLQ